MEMNATPGKYMFIAGQKYDRGILVLGIRVVDK
jgi:hypothetical protein